MAERFTRPDVPTSILPIPALPPAVPIALVPGDPGVELSLNSVGMTTSEHVEQRAVWQRDGEQCTFVSEDGHRCEERRFVELDHIEAVARGGEATEANLRVLCRAHNQLEAERTFGAEFMRNKRAAASEARAAAREGSVAVAPGP